MADAAPRKDRKRKKKGRKKRKRKEKRKRKGEKRHTGEGLAQVGLVQWDLTPPGGKQGCPGGGWGGKQGWIIPVKSSAPPWRVWGAFTCGIGRERHDQLCILENDPGSYY